jgi:hypothetical protein
MTRGQRESFPRAWNARGCRVRASRVRRAGLRSVRAGGLRAEVAGEDAVPLHDGEVVDFAAEGKERCGPKAALPVHGHCRQHRGLRLVVVDGGELALNCRDAVEDAGGALEDEEVVALGVHFEEDSGLGGQVGRALVEYGVEAADLNDLATDGLGRAGEAVCAFDGGEQRVEVAGQEEVDLGGTLGRSESIGKDLPLRVSPGGGTEAFQGRAHGFEAEDLASVSHVAEGLSELSEVRTDIEDAIDLQLAEDMAEVCHVGSGERVESEGFGKSFCKLVQGIPVPGLH